METMVADDVTRRILARWDSAEMIVACGWCQRVEFDDEWHLAPRWALAAIDQLAVTHGICPSCSARVFRGV